MGNEQQKSKLEKPTIVQEKTDNEKVEIKPLFERLGSKKPTLQPTKLSSDKNLLANLLANKGSINRTLTATQTQNRVNIGEEFIEVDKTDKPDKPDKTDDNEVMEDKEVKERKELKKESTKSINLKEVKQVKEGNELKKQSSKSINFKFEGKSSKSINLQSEKNLRRMSIDPRELEFQGKYELVKKLGEGRHGKVFEVKSKITGESSALKIYKRNTKIYKEYDEAEEEANIINQLNHPNIIKITDFLSTKENHYVFLELAKGGDLSQQILPSSSFSETNAAIIIKQLFILVSYMHENNVVNRDIKTKNILLKTKKIGDYSILLTGFESAIILNYSKTGINNYGLADYKAPEVLKKKEFTTKSDVFSCGVIMYEILSGNLPFKMSYNKVLGEYERLEDFNFEKRCWDNISNLAKDLIRKLLKENPSKRISAAEAVKDPWILKYFK